MDKLTNDFKSMSEGLTAIRAEIAKEKAETVVSLHAIRELKAAETDVLVGMKHAINYGS